MLFGDDKARQMARSILPSRWRGAATYRAQLHRAARRGVNASLRSLTRDPSEWDDGVDFDAWLPPELGMFVSRRRGADKLRHFERWAVLTTKALPRGSRLAAMRAVLPGGLIGEHALLHLKQLDAFAPSGRRLRYRRVSVWLDEGELTKRLTGVVDTAGGLAALNEALRRGRRVVSPGREQGAGPRRLHGRHDIAGFLRALRAERVGRAVVDDFCRALKASRGDVAAALTEALVVRALPILDFRCEPRWEWIDEPLSSGAPC
jgi:hypothetical protein